MAYSVKEIFYTLQGEGTNAGRPAVFCRFAGCNLWSGREADRAQAICRFCDTDFVGVDGTGGGRFASARLLAEAVKAHWRASTGQPLVVLTGGEPLLQVDRPLIDALHAQGLEIAVETNGTVRAPRGIDWLCVSPKHGSELLQRSGDELKVVVPQVGLDLDALVRLPFDHHLVQAMDGPLQAVHLRWARALCLRDPRWRLSVQLHKLLGIR
jgi:7-carboxy-7-deazaguanine synthase (Cx14CxxC type)